MKNLFFCLILLSAINFAGLTQDIKFDYFIVQKSKKHSNYLRSNAVWVAPTPLVFVNYKFSADYGSSWHNVGVFGGNLRPYIAVNSPAMVSLNGFTAVRALGMAQIIAVPVLFGKGLAQGKVYQDTGPPYSPDDENTGDGYITASFFSLLSGVITYYFISRPALKNAMLHFYSNKHSQNHQMNLPVISVNYITEFKSPAMSLAWAF